MRKLLHILLILILCSSLFAQQISNDSKPIFGQQIGGQFAERLVGLWTFAGQTGNLPDSSHYSNHGAITGATWQGQGLFFDGGDYVDLGMQDFVNTGLFCDSGEQFSVIAAFKAASSVTGSIVAKAGAAGGSRTFQMYLTTNGILASNLRGSINSTGITLADGTWHTVVYTWDGTTARFYIDGVSRGTLPVGVAAEEAQNVIIGARTGGAGFRITGNISYVLIYSRALSTSEIQALYIRQWLMFEDTTPVWMFSGAEVIGRIIQGIGSGIYTGVYR